MSLFHRKEKVETTDLSKRFDLIGRVGQGSMSKVWRADDSMNGRFVAVKVLDKEKTTRYESRFKGLNKPNEADIALSLHHPNIVRTFEVGHTTEGEMFLVMEYVEGSGLSLLVDLQSDRMCRYRTRYMIQIGDALSYFHDHHWIHRDICPRNIMVSENNDIKLIDFGLTVPDTPDFRKPGNRTGTANYMAPELIKRQPTDQRIDVFSYAVTCFEMYTKRHPWDAAMTIDAVLQHINKPPIPLQDLVPRIDPQIASAIMKGLEANPADRWSCISDMVKEFRQAEVRMVKATRELLARRRKNQTAAGARPTGTNSSKPELEAIGKSDKGSKPKSAVQQPVADEAQPEDEVSMAAHEPDTVKPDAPVALSKSDGRDNKNAGAKPAPRVNERPSDATEEKSAPADSDDVDEDEPLSLD